MAYSTGSYDDYLWRLHASVESGQDILLFRDEALNYLTNTGISGYFDVYSGKAEAELQKRHLVISGFMFGQNFLF